MIPSNNKGDRLVPCEHAIAFVIPYPRNMNIMPLKAPKTPLQPDTEAEPTTPTVAHRAALDIENLIADSLLEEINWQKVRSVLIERARQKFWIWLSSQILPETLCTQALNEIEASAISEVVSDA